MFQKAAGQKEGEFLTAPHASDLETHTHTATATDRHADGQADS